MIPAYSGHGTVARGQADLKENVEDTVSTRSPLPHTLEETAGEVPGQIRGLADNIQQAFLGKPQVVRNALVCLFAGGHLLIEDVPGVGKTLLARALARSIDCRFQRIQFTPDLLPTDVLGVSVFNMSRDEFVFKPGPIFANVILADEINRTTPRTQSALLEAMNDFQVSIDGVTHPLPEPFIVLATQNPFEFEGTYPLPESQLDRFLMRLRIGYPSLEDEKQVLETRKLSDPLDALQSVLEARQVLQLQRRTREVAVEDSVAEYILRISDATRGSDELVVGASPRGSVFLYRAAQALALIQGRDYCVPDDVKELAPLVLGHRVVPRAGFRPGSDHAGEEVVRHILEAVPVPE